ncbi:MAG TPA: hypothetical protein VHX60_09690 [Acidobacteriaceae bacterium]|nr:hypothetical protein [Acidobacteriaceae bacterium]
MPRSEHEICRMAVLLLFLIAAVANGQPVQDRAPAGASAHAPSIVVTVVDEDGLAIPEAQISIDQPGQPPVHIATDYLGRCAWIPREPGAFSLRADKPGFYETAVRGLAAGQGTVRIVLTHEQMVQQEVNVTASSQGIDTQQISDRSSLNVPEIVNVPFPTNRDIRNLLPFTPGIVQDSTGQVHVAGGETWMTLDTLDGFDIRSPLYGSLDLRISTDAVRSIDTETTRYPVEYGRSTAGVLAFTTGMGDNKFRYDATNFIPSLRNENGIRFDTFEPRITVSGPLKRDRAWFFEGFEFEYDDIFVPGLPANADTDHLIRGSNLLKAQTNLGHANSLSGALLFNDFHSPYDGISALTPQPSTDNLDIAAWLPYVRDQQSFRNGIVLDTGLGEVEFRDGFEPHGASPYTVTPELPSGSYFETSTSHSRRIEGYENVYFPSRRLAGSHQIRAGVNLDTVRYDENLSLAPVNYLREDGTLLRRSTFPAFAPFVRHNLELGSYVEDRWTPGRGFLIEPGLRFDWDEIVRRPLYSPRLALNYSPPGLEGSTRLSAGVGEYYEHTQLEFLSRALAGTRYDTYYAADGATPTGPAEETQFVANQGKLREAHALNWSVGAEQKLPARVYLGGNFMQRHESSEFVYAHQNNSGALWGTYLLTNARRDHYHSIEVEARRSFGTWYTLFASFTHSSATTNTALDYIPTLSLLGPQQPGPLAWNVPNRFLSWGWLPAWAPWLPTVHKNWDFVYTLDVHSGFPIDSVNANQQIAGAAGSHYFPDYVNFSPGLEWRFHFGGKYFGLRGVFENSTDAQDPYVVNNNVDSPQYLTFLQPLGRAFTTRIRLIQSSK